jgi:ribosome recycling factor
MLTKDIISKAEEKMKKTVEATKHEFSAVRTGRASASLLERIQVECYGTTTPIRQVASISVPDPQLLIIQPWDKSIIPQIEKAVMQANLGISPSNDGKVVRLPFPPLSEERRKELVKLVRQMTEESRVAVRNIRRDANEHIKAMEKNEHLSEDESKRAQDEVQKITDKYIKQIDQLLELKEKEVMEV